MFMGRKENQKEEDDRNYSVLVLVGWSLIAGFVAAPAAPTEWVEANIQATAKGRAFYWPRVGLICPDYQRLCSCGQLTTRSRQRCRFCGASGGGDFLQLPHV